MNFCRSRHAVNQTCRTRANEFTEARENGPLGRASVLKSKVSPLFLCKGTEEHAFYLELICSLFFRKKFLPMSIHIRIDEWTGADTVFRRNRSDYGSSKFVGGSRTCNCYGRTVSIVGDDACRGVRLDHDLRSDHNGGRRGGYYGRRWSPDNDRRRDNNLPLRKDNRSGYDRLMDNNRSWCPYDRCTSCYDITDRLDSSFHDSDSRIFAAEPRTAAALKLSREFITAEPRNAGRFFVHIGWNRAQFFSGNPGKSTLIVAAAAVV